MKRRTRWAAALCCLAAALGIAGNAQAQTGACCSGTTCTATTTGCNGNLIFLSGGSCSPNACQGACCSGTGTCTLTASGSCSGTSTFLGLGTTCTAGICTPLLGACCPLTGGCTAAVTAANCGTAAAPANFAGVGSTCSPTPCTTTSGACCGTNGACTVTLSTACALPSAFTATGTACTPTNPCTVPTGACCSNDGATCTVKPALGSGAAGACGASGETYVGNDSTCGGAPCAAYTGACCSTAGVCSTRTIAGCAATNNQTFQGVGTTCGSNPCVTGACCAPAGTCSITVASGCGLSVTNFGLSVYMGNGSTCASIGSCFGSLGNGACCPNGTNACTLTTPQGCGTAQFATYQGNNTTCSPTDPCAPLRGACCSTAGACTQTVAVGCFGGFQGAGTTCTPSPCFNVGGACCNPVGGCFFASNSGGNGCGGTNSFRGAGTVCFPTPCPALLGRCCSGVGFCSVTIQSGCLNPNTFTGVVGASASCSPDPCPALKGACCSNIGACTQTIASGCTGSSSFAGVGIACSPNPCTATSGACCDLNAGTCTLTAAPPACTGANVLWGQGVSCNPGNPCSPQPTGACCIGFTCSANQDGGLCTQTGGVFFFGQACSPTPCVRPSVVISQIYPGGGSQTAPYNADYVELYNYGSTAVSLANWSLQYGAQSTQTFPSRVNLSGTINPGRYFLIQLNSTDPMVGAPLPTPDLVSTAISLDISAGRIALVQSTNALPNGCPQPIPVNIVDFVGYGTPSGSNAPTCSEGGSPAGGLGGNVFAYYRKASGCIDSDNNGNDFSVPLAPNPRNSSVMYTCGSSAVGACCTGDTGNSSGNSNAFPGFCNVTTSAACSTAPAGFQGEGTTCSTFPCVVPKGACCTLAGACSLVIQGGCATPSVYLYGRSCSPDPCNGACCTGTSCVFSSIAVCNSPSYFITGAACTLATCATPVVVLSGDIAYGASVSQNQDAVQQIRGAGSASPSRVGTWTKYDSQQSMRFDNHNGVLHNARGNLLGLNFGSTGNGGSIYNFPTNGDGNAGQTLLFFNSATSATSGSNSLTLSRTRFAGMSVSPNNDRVAVIGYDLARLMVLHYNPGGSVGSGTGANFDAAAETNSSFAFGFNITQGTAWLDNNTVLMWVLSDIGSVLKLYSVPVSGSGTTISLGTPVELLAIADNKPNASRFTSIAYNPQLIPGYIFLGASAFQGISLNSVYVVRTSDWSIAKAIDLNTSLQTERELAIGPDRNLYLSQYAGSGTFPTDTLIDKIILDSNADGVVTDTEITSLVSDSSMDFYFKGAANTAAFNGFDIAVSLGACCNGTVCALQPPNFCTGGNGTYKGDNTTCSPVNACLITGVCCRGATCNTGIQQASCTGNTLAGAFFANSNNCNAVNNTTTPCCFPDYNKTDGVQVSDIFDFLNDWFAGSQFAIVGGDGSSGILAVQNIFDFLNAWFAGGC